MTTCLFSDFCAYSLFFLQILPDFLTLAKFAREPENAVKQLEL